MGLGIGFGFSVYNDMPFTIFSPYIVRRFYSLSWQFFILPEVVEWVDDVDSLCALLGSLEVLDGVVE